MMLLAYSALRLENLALQSTPLKRLPWSQGSQAHMVCVRNCYQIKPI
jgi:hypothetical protein